MLRVDLVKFYLQFLICSYYKQQNKQTILLIDYSADNKKMQNQFLSTPLNQKTRTTKQMKLNIQQKQALVKTLQAKNDKLHKDIRMIERSMKEKFGKEDEEKNQQPNHQNRQSIMKTQDNPQILTKQISNCYKRIKHYEYQIGKLKARTVVTNSMSDRVMQVEEEVRQKKIIENKLKQQLYLLERQLKENNRKLEDNNFQTQIEKQNKLKTQELKFLKEMVRQYEQKEAIKQKNLKSQFNHIKKLEKQFVQEEGSMHELQAIKQKAVNSFESGRLKSHKQDLNQQFEQHHPQGLNKSIMLTNSRQKTKNNIEKQEIIEDRTKDHFESIMNEIKVLQKLDVNYQKQLMQSEYGYKDAQSKCLQAKERLAKLQKDTQQLQAKISLKKSAILAGNMKPLRSASLYNPVKNKIDAMKAQNLNHSNVSVLKNNKKLKHTLKIDSVGLLSGQGTSFTDRGILGDPKVLTKITGLIVYIDKNRDLVGGFQATYNTRKKGAEHLKKDKNARLFTGQDFRADQYICKQGDFVKSIGGTLNNSDKLECLSIITEQGKNHLFGSMKNTKKGFMLELQDDQIPVCLFGSLKMMTEPINKEYSTIQYFGAEIAKLQKQKVEEQGQNEIDSSIIKTNTNGRDSGMNTSRLLE